MHETTLVSRILYDGKILRLRVDTVQLPDGRTSEREIVERDDGVAIVPVLPDGRFLLIKQYRHAHGGVVITLPGGGVDSRDRSSRAAAQRELFEETGYKARHLQHLFTSGGSSTIKHSVYTYLASDLYRPQQQRSVDDEEVIRFYPQSQERALALVRNGKIPSVSVSLALILAAERLAKENHHPRQ